MSLKCIYNVQRWEEAGINSRVYFAKFPIPKILLVQGREEKDY